MARFTFLIIFTVLSLFCQGQGDEIANNLKLADTQFNLGNYTKSLTIIEDILAMHPENLEAQEKKLNILMKLERSKDALADIEEYIKLYPGQPVYYYLRAVANLQNQKYTRAISDFNSCLDMNMPENALYKVYLNRGMAYFNIAEFELSEADFNEALSRNSKSAAAYHGKGMVKYELNQFEEAVTVFKQSLQIDDSNAITHFNLAMAFFRLDDEENSCYHFNRSCALGHRNACRLLLMECDVSIPGQ